MENGADRVLRIGDLAIDLNARRVRARDAEVPLTTLEFDLFAELAAHPGWVYTHHQLAERLCGPLAVGTRVVSVHVANVRRKLAESGGDPAWIQTVRGVGYRLDVSGAGGASPSPSDPPSRDLFVGRSAELAQLEAAMAAAARGEGGVALLLGETGIGKTRLATEASQRAEAIGAVSLWGRANHDGSARPFWPWSQVVRQCLERFDPEAARRAFERRPALGAILSSGSKAQPPRVGPSRGSASRLEAFEGVAEFLRELAGERPTMIVIDDVHIADEPSVLLLEHLVHAVGEARILLVANVGDGPADRATLERLFHAIATHRRSVRLSLTGLSLDDVAELARAWSLDGQADAVAQAILAHTSGNPFFVLETLRVLEQDPEALNPAKAGHALSPGVREVVWRRLSGLPASTLDLLRAATVLGLGFEVDVLARMAGLPLGALLRRLQPALDSHVLTHADSPGWLRFSHAMARLALYGSIDAGDRLALHAAAAEIMERDPDRRPARLAQLALHYREAVPAGYAPQAVRYAAEAGEASLAAGGFEVALEHFGTGLELLERVHLGDREERAFRARLESGLGDAHAALGDADSAVPAYRIALAALPASRNVDRASLFGRIAAAQTEAKLAGEAGSSLESGLRALEASGRRTRRWWETWVDLRLQEMMLAYFSGGPDPMAEDPDSAAAVEEHADPPRLLRYHRARLLMGLRDDRHVPSPDTLAHARRQFEVAQQVGDPGEVAWAETMLGATLVWTDDHAAARDHLVRAFSAASMALAAPVMAYAAGNLCLLERVRGDVDEVRRWVGEFDRMPPGALSPDHAGGAAGMLAWLALREGDMPACERLALEAIEALQQVPAFPFQWMARFPLLAYRRAQRRADECAEHARAMLLPAQQMLGERVAEALESALARFDAGDVPGADAGFATAVELGRECGYT